MIRFDNQWKDLGKTYSAFNLLNIELFVYKNSYDLIFTFLGFGISIYIPR